MYWGKKKAYDNLLLPQMHESAPLACGWGYWGRKAAQLNLHEKDCVYININAEVFYKHYLKDPYS